MKLLFLGSGSAHTVDPDNFQSNLMLTANSGRRLLIDCGSDVRWSLAKQGLSYLDVTDIYISHLHADHIGGLEYVGFQTRFDPRCERPRLYIEASLAGPLWDHALRGGMRVISGMEAELDTFFDVRIVNAYHPFEWEGTWLEPIPSVHVSGPVSTVHSYGLAIDCDGHRTFLTTDTQFTPSLLSRHYARADLIFHDCEIGPGLTGVHAGYEDLVRLPADVRAKTWLYGYQPAPLPDAVAHGFRGFVRAGQAFHLLQNSAIRQAST
jgi:ribonuclease BN (tRNA processing enzyme)